MFKKMFKMMFKKRTLKLKQVILASFGGFFLVFLGVGLVVKFSTNNLVNALILVRNSYELQQKINYIKISILEADTIQKGFLYTGDESFLLGYDVAVNNVNKNLAMIYELETNNIKAGDKKSVKTIEQLDVLSDLIIRKLSEFDNTISYKKAKNEAELMSFIRSGEGKRVMDLILSNLDKIEQDQIVVLNQRKERVQEADRLTSLSLMGGLGFTFVIGLLILWLVDRQIIVPINKVTGVIANISSVIASNVDRQEEAANIQAVSVNQTTTTMDELSSTSIITAQRAQTSAMGAADILDLVHEETVVINNTQMKMADLQGKVSEMQLQIRDLNKQIRLIGSISELVSDLATQTNMLAINAAVEAVRAGDQGKGFGVVAAEIRKLADQSKQSGEKINELVRDLQLTITRTVKVTESGVEIVIDGVKSANDTVSTFGRVANAINGITMSSQEISLTAKQQAIAIQQVLDAMTALNKGASATAIAMRETKVGTHKLNEAALTLKSVI